MGKFKVTGIEEEEEQEIFNGKDTIKEDVKNGLREVVEKKIFTNLRIVFLGNYNPTFSHS